jgi:charged multivesicular body protein 3
MSSAKVLARELVKSRKAKSRLHQSKANISGISMQLTQQASMYKMQKTLGKSAQIMAMMNQVVKLPALQKVMMAMSREMEKAGLIEELMDEALEEDDVEDEAEEQLDMVLDEILQGVKAAPTHNASLPVEAEAEPATDEADEMSARLAQLKA